MRIARVQFLIPLPEPFDYEVPEEYLVEPGNYVMAQVGPTPRLGVVWEVLEKPSEERELKPIEHVFDAPPLSAAMRNFVDWSARYLCTPPGTILRMVARSREGLRPSPTETVYRATGDAPPRMTDARSRVILAAQTNGPMTNKALCDTAQVSAGVVTGLAKAGALEAEKRAVDLPYARPKTGTAGYELTPQQAQAAEALREAVASHAFRPVLLDGITGSGKTEVYFEAIDEALSQSPTAQVLVLLPEIALTQAILSRFEKRFGARPVEWHSSISQKDRRRAWREVAFGRARIVVGARSALFLPFPNLRLTVIDEEHDASYKQEEGGVYHARDLGVVRAKLENAAIVLASATPALETLTNAETGRYDHIKLYSRVGTAVLPDIELIDMKIDKPEKGEWLSPRLKQALEENFADKGQSLLFLNRRGYAPLVLCAACGEKLKTPGTESWLVEHRYTGRLVCHLTGFSMPKPRRCPECGATNSLRGIGPGVERVAEDVRKLLPDARIEIFSSDTAQTAEDVKSIVQRMADGEIDVMVGTQIVAKGHNFRGLTLVGVVDADSGLKGGDLRAGERTYQLLSQVAGRAGRAEKPGRALIQTYQPDSPTMQALANGDRDSFLAAERDMREVMGLPPFGRLAAFVMSAASEQEAEDFAREVAARAPVSEAVEIWGPAPAPIGVLRGRYRWRLLARSDRNLDLSAYVAAWRKALKVRGTARISIDIDPYSFL